LAAASPVAEDDALSLLGRRRAAASRGSGPLPSDLQPGQRIAAGRRGLALSPGWTVWYPADTPVTTSQLAQPEPFPVRVNVELTNYCNQRCTLCPRQRFTRPLGFMARDVFERVVRECAPHGTRLWLHFLGEPTLHRDLLSMIRFAKGAGVHEVGLSTNAVSLHGKLADGLLHSGLARLECSLDADDREAYLAMRGRDHFERVIENVRAFFVRKRELGLDEPVTSVQIMRTPESEAALPRLIAAWQALFGPHDFAMQIAPASFVGAIEAPVAGDAERVPCRWLFSSLMVLQDGTVTMCGADWDARAPLGNVRDSTIAEIWHGAELARRRRAHLDGAYGDVPLCGACQDWRLADGRGYQRVELASDGAVSSARG
jgi:MoaA/NifB/PqqE/SkfB family radical SAM enzyme